MQLCDRQKAELQTEAIQQRHDRLELVLDDDRAVGGGGISSERYEVQSHCHGQFFLACVRADEFRSSQHFRRRAVQDIERPAAQRVAVLFRQRHGLLKDVPLISGGRHEHA